MVDALHEIWRVLVPGGIVIDIRPLGERWPIEVVSSTGSRATGRVEDLGPQLSADAASNDAIRAASEHGWFLREEEELFPYLYSWDTPRDMEEFIAEDWGDFISLGEEARQTTRSVWASSNADSRVRLRMKILITRWRKITDAAPRQDRRNTGAPGPVVQKPAEPVEE